MFSIFPLWDGKQIAVRTADILRIEGKAVGDPSDGDASILFLQVGNGYSSYTLRGTAAENTALIRHDDEPATHDLAALREHMDEATIRQIARREANMAITERVGFPQYDHQAFVREVQALREHMIQNDLLAEASIQTLAAQLTQVQQEQAATNAALTAIWRDIDRLNKALAEGISR